MRNLATDDVRSVGTESGHRKGENRAVRANHTRASILAAFRLSAAMPRYTHGVLFVWLKTQEAIMVALG